MIIIVSLLSVLFSSVAHENDAIRTYKITQYIRVRQLLREPVSCSSVFLHVDEREEVKNTKFTVN